MKIRRQTVAMKQDMVYIPLNELITRVLRGRIRLREINQPHVKVIKTYILSNLENKKVFLPPLVGHLEHGSIAQCLDGEISIIDGSHRLKAYVQIHQLALKTIHRMDEHERNKAFQILEVFKNSILPIQLHEGLTIEEQHQFYLDLNLLRNQTSIKKRKCEKNIGHEKTLG